MVIIKAKDDSAKNHLANILSYVASEISSRNESTIPLVTFIDYVEIIPDELKTLLKSTLPGGWKISIKSLSEMDKSRVIKTLNEIISAWSDKGTDGIELSKEKIASLLSLINRG